MAKSDTERAFTDAQTALDAVLAKREALSFVESELLQERYLRVDEKGSRARRVLDAWCPELGMVKADDGSTFKSIGFSPTFPQRLQRVEEARLAYDDAFARFVEAARARDAEVARELADSQAKSAKSQAEAAERQAKSAEEQAKSAKAQADAATAQTEIAKTVRNLTVAIFIATAVQAIAAAASCSGPAGKSPDVRPDGGQATGSPRLPEASISASASSPPTEPSDGPAGARPTDSGGDGGRP